MKHFGAARGLVSLTEYSQSVTAVQTVLCMCLYLKSISAPRLAHTYVSMATYAAYVNPAEVFQRGTFPWWSRSSKSGSQPHDRATPLSHVPYGEPRLISHTYPGTSSACTRLEGRAMLPRESERQVGEFILP